jgi:hypothetical protein
MLAPSHIQLDGQLERPAAVSPRTHPSCRSAAAQAAGVGAAALVEGYVWLGTGGGVGCCCCCSSSSCCGGGGGGEVGGGDGGGGGGGGGFHRSHGSVQALIDESSGCAAVTVAAAAADPARSATMTCDSDAGIYRFRKPGCRSLGTVRAASH